MSDFEIVMLVTMVVIFVAILVVAWN